MDERCMVTGCEKGVRDPVDRVDGEVIVREFLAQSPRKWWDVPYTPQKMPTHHQRDQQSRPYGSFRYRQGWYRRKLYIQGRLVGSGIEG